MPDLPDLVYDTELETSFEGQNTIHYHDDYTENGRITRPSAGSNTWEQIKILGHGGFGQVYLQRCIKGHHTGRERAVKVVHVGNRQEEYYREIEAIAKFSQRRFSKYFVQFHGWYENESTLFIAMEYLPNGDMQGYMDEYGVLSEIDTKDVGFQVLMALKWMHGDRFSHRDIKPSNILIKAQPPVKSGWWVKLSDFGISKRLGNTNSMTTIKGTLPFMAPELLELLQGDTDSHQSVDHIAADMWSLGEVLFRMLTGCAVFRSNRERYRYLEDPQLFPSDRITTCGISDQASSLISALMKPLPESRLRSDRALAHEWFQSLKRKESPHRSPNDSALKFESQSTSSGPASVPRLTSTNHADPWATVNTELTVLPQPRVDLVEESADSALGSTGNQRRVSELPFVPERPNPPALPADTQQPPSPRVSPELGHLKSQFNPGPACKLPPKVQFKGHESTIISTIISGDGLLMASKSKNGTIKVWDVPNVKCLHTFKDTGTVLKEVFAATFSPDGRRLVAATSNRNIHVWDMQTGDRLRKLYDRLGSEFRDGKWILDVVMSVVVSVDGQFVAAVYDNSTGAEILDMETGLYQNYLSFPQELTLSSCKAGGGDMFTQDRFGTVAIWKMEPLQRLWTVDTGIRAPCLRTAISTSGWVAYGYPGYIKIFDIQSGQRLHTLKSRSSNIKSIVFSEDNRFMACVYGDETIKIWDPKEGQCLQTLNQDGLVVHAVTFSKHLGDGALMVSTSSDSLLKIGVAFSLD